MFLSEKQSFKRILSRILDFHCNVHSVVYQIYRDWSELACSCEREGSA